MVNHTSVSAHVRDVSERCTNVNGKCQKLYFTSRPLQKFPYSQLSSIISTNGYAEVFSRRQKLHFRCGQTKWIQGHLSGARGKIVLNVRKRVMRHYEAWKSISPIFSHFPVQTCWGHYPLLWFRRFLWAFCHLCIMRKSFGPKNPFPVKVNKDPVGLIEHFTHVTQWKIVCTFSKSFQVRTTKNVGREFVC